MAYPLMMNLNGNFVSVMSVSKNAFLMSQLKRHVNSKTLKVFYSSHIMPHVNFASTIWDGCGEIHLSKINSLHRCAATWLIPDKNLSTDKKQKALSILPLQRQLSLTLMFKVNRGMIPSCVTYLFGVCNNRTIRYILPKPRIDLYKTREHVL